MIKKIVPYNIPFRYSSQDRIVENVEAKLEKYKDDEITNTDFSYMYSNEVEGSITINSIKKYNYLKIEFNNDKVLYYFLTTNEAVQSENAITYTYKIDVMASFGEKIFENLNGKLINIERMHQDRYNIDGDDLTINLDNSGLVRTNFKLGNLTGNKILFDGSGADVYYKESYSENGGPIQWNSLIIKNDQDIDKEQLYSQYNINSVVGYGKRLGTTDDPKTIFLDILSTDVKNLINKNIRIRNGINIKTKDGIRKTYWAYAIVQGKGVPIIDYNFTDQYLVPISVEYVADSTSSKFGDLNTIQNLSNILQEGKILNIVLSPFKLTSGGTGSYIDDIRLIDLYNSSGAEISSPSSVKGLKNYMAFVLIDTDNWMWFKGDYRSKSHTLQIDTSTLKENKMFNTYYVKMKITEFLQNLENDKYSVETGLLNSSISPIKMYFNETPITLDIYNFLSRDKTDKFRGSFNISPMGISANIQISNFQFVEYSENRNWNYSSNAAASFLANNKFAIEAQKVGVQLNNQLSKQDVEINRVQTIGQASNLMSGLTSLFASTATSSIAASYQLDKLNILDNIEENEINKINAQIKDQKCSAPQFKMGGSDDYLWGLMNEFKYKFNWTMQIPNKLILNNIYNNIQKFGCLYGSYANFTNEIWTSREKWNYLKIINIKEHLLMPELTEDIIDEIDKRFEMGVRIFHKDDFKINYGENNIEIKIKNYLDNLKNSV